MQIQQYGFEAHVNQPEITGKFIQIQWQTEEHLLFAPFSLCDFHIQILSRFLDAQQIGYVWTDTQALRYQAPGLSVMGGGRFHLDNPARHLQLSDKSQVFGRFQTAGLANRIAATTSHPWHSWQVTVL